MSRIIWTWKTGPTKITKMMSNRLAMAGLMLRNEHRKNVNRAWPPSSVVGEYPARRTGRLRDGLLLEVEPRRASIVETTYYWRYLAYMSRLGLRHTWWAMKNQITKYLLKGS